MKAADQSILNLLSTPRRLELTPSNVARNVDISRVYSSERLSKLEEYGLVQVDKKEGSHPYYSITERGEAFLNNELRPEQLEEK